MTREIPSPASARVAFFASKNPQAGAAGAGPIGATAQTMPEMFSAINATLDHVPMSLLPLGLTDEQRQRIYQAVMADKSAPATDTGNLVRTSVLPTQVALNEMYDLPSSVGDIALVRGLKYVKAKNKVFLVEPVDRMVVDEIPD